MEPDRRGLDGDLSTAFGSTLSVLRKVERGDLEKATPCASWNVRALNNHFVGTARWWAATVRREERPAVVDEPGVDSDSDADEDYAAGDFVAAYEESARIALGAFEAAAASQRTVQLPWGGFPVAAVQAFAATDQFVHGWDLARALGLDTDLAPDLARVLLDGSKLAIGEAMRGQDGVAPFGPARRAPEGSSAADRFAAFLGRAV